jgi:hypothetical protein
MFARPLYPRQTRLRGSAAASNQRFKLADLIVRKFVIGVRQLVNETLETRTERARARPVSLLRLRAGYLPSWPRTAPPGKFGRLCTLT